MTDPTAADLSARLRELSPTCTMSRTKTKRPQLAAAIALSAIVSIGVGFSIGYAVAPSRGSDVIAIDRSGWEWLVSVIAEQNDILPKAAERILREKLHLRQ